MSKLKVATIWLDGCSGCHMSVLDIDERLIELAEHVEFVYSPLVDFKKYPEDVDLALIEGAVGYDEDVEKLHMVRERTKILIALGDCAVAGNVPTMRNPYAVEELMDRAFVETSSIKQQFPSQSLPELLKTVRPIHEVVDVDVFVQGCPPSADVIYYTLTELIAGRTPDLSDKTRPGA